MTTLNNVIDAAHNKPAKELPINVIMHVVKGKHKFIAADKANEAVMNISKTEPMTWSISEPTLVSGIGSDSVRAIALPVASRVGGLSFIVLYFDEESKTKPEFSVCYVYSNGTIITYNTGYDCGEWLNSEKKYRSLNVSILNKRRINRQVINVKFLQDNNMLEESLIYTFPESGDVTVNDNLTTYRDTPTTSVTVRPKSGVVSTSMFDAFLTVKQKGEAVLASEPTKPIPVKEETPTVKDELPTVNDEVTMKVITPAVVAEQVSKESELIELLSGEDELDDSIDVESLIDMIADAVAPTTNMVAQLTKTVNDYINRPKEPIKTTHVDDKIISLAKSVDNVSCVINNNLHRVNMTLNQIKDNGELAVLQNTQILTMVSRLQNNILDLQPQVEVDTKAVYVGADGVRFKLDANGNKCFDGGFGVPNVQQQVPQQQHGYANAFFGQRPQQHQAPQQPMWGHEMFSPNGVHAHVRPHPQQANLGGLGPYTTDPVYPKFGKNDKLTIEALSVKVEDQEKMVQSLNSEIQRQARIIASLKEQEAKNTKAIREATVAVEKLIVNVRKP